MKITKISKKAMNDKNVNWYYLCLEMMLAYIPQALDSKETFSKVQEISDHFISLSKTLDEKTQNKIILTFKDTEDIANVKQLMAHISRQNYELIKDRAIEIGVFKHN